MYLCDGQPFRKVRGWMGWRRYSSVGGSGGGDVEGVRSILPIQFLVRRRTSSLTYVLLTQRPTWMLTLSGRVSCHHLSLN